MARFKLFPRYRRPSLKTALGITRAKRQLKTRSGYYAATRWTRARRVTTSAVCSVVLATILAQCGSSASFAA